MPELPPPLPPAERTVGQFVGETIRAYGENFWRALPLGVPLAVADQIAIGQQRGGQVLVFLAVGPLVVAAYVWACSLVLQVRPTLTAFLVGGLIYLPFPALRAVLFLPGDRVVRVDRPRRAGGARRAHELPRVARPRPRARDDRLHPCARLARDSRPRRRDRRAGIDGGCCTRRATRASASRCSAPTSC